MEEVKVTDKITVLNDAFRRSGQGVVVTRGIQAMEDMMGLMMKVRKYDNFSEANDAYGEHDFGSLMWEGEKVFWKIDYYDMSLTHWEDPLSDRCKRVMTVMLADEY